MKVVMLFFIKPIARFIGAIIAVSVIALMIAGAVSSPNAAVAGYQKATDKVSFYSGVSLATIPHMVTSAMAGKTYVDNSAAGQSTVPSSIKKNSVTGKAATKKTAQQVAADAKKACAGATTAKARTQCEATYVAAQP